MKTLRSALLAVVVVAASAMAADVTLMKMVGPDAKMVAGVNLARSRTTPFGQFLISQLKAEDKDFAAFVATTQFDPRRDLAEVLLASSGGSGPGAGLMAARGTFQVSAITSLARSKGRPVERYAGATLVRWAAAQPGRQDAVAFVDGAIAVAGPLEQVKAALLRRVKGPGMNAALAAKVAEVSRQYDAWAVSAAPMADVAAHVENANVSGAMKGDALQSIQQVSGGMSFGDVVKIAGEAVTRSEKDAAALVDVVRFLASMVLMNRPGGHPGLTAAVEKMELTTSGSVAKMSLAIPEEQLEQLILSRPKRVRVQPVAARP
jgi:hypothetical protein